MRHLCEHFALPRLSNIGPVPGQVSISLADRAAGPGEDALEITQFIEIYFVADGHCERDGF